MMKKNWSQNLPVVLLAAAIGLSPSFSAGMLKGGRIIEIRAEDILLVILGLVWITNFLISGRKKIEKPPLLGPILAWLGVGLFSVLTNWILGNIEFLPGFFYFLKELEFFFLYFYLFYHIRSLDSAKFIIKIWIFLGLANVGWIIYQAITGLKLSFYYAPTAFIEPQGSSPSGGFFLILFIFLFNVLLFYYLNFKISKFKKGILAMMALSPAIGVFTSGSRGSFWALVLALIFTFLLYFFKKRNFKSILAIILIMIFLFAIFIYFSSIFSGAKRAVNIESVFWEFSAKEGTRFSAWEGRSYEIVTRPLFTLFGLGKSASEESHSQYVKNFVETGIIGSLIFLFLIFIIIKKAFQGFSSGGNPFLRGLSVGLLAATLAMLLLSIGNDAFIVVKINEVYWFFVALTMAVWSLNKKKEITSSDNL